MKMLINATRAEQLRVAVVEGTTLHEYQVQIDESGLTRGNIYRGVVANIQPSLNAAFIDIGEERHGFLPVADVLESAYQQNAKKSKRPNIDQVLKKGQPILVQVTKDGIGQKGAALTTNIALAGRYLVLTPFDSVRGISRKAEDDKDRKTIKSRLKKLDLPESHGVIVRTNGIDQNQVTLTRDMNALMRLWRKVQGESDRGKGPRLLYSDQDLVVQALRDYLDPEIEQVVVDNDEVYEKAEDYMKAFMPRSKTKLVRYKDSLPLFSRYRLETQIDKIYERTAALPSGGSIVIDLTEALTAIDVNSGRATRNANHEDSIFKINCEAAEEVARQLRLRDIGGLVVVDFIDMRLRKHQARLERIMRDAMKPDKARYSVGRVSPNGLLEINRQRIKQSLRLRTHRPCPTCNGQATIPTPEFSAQRLLSRIEGRAASGRMKHVTVALHPEMADMLQNHFRRELMGLEQDHNFEVEIIAASTLRRTEERLDWVERSDEEAKALEKARRKEPAFSSTDLTAESRHRSPKPRKRDDDEQPQRQAQSSRRSQQDARSDSNEDGGDDGEKKTSSRRRRSRRRRDDDRPQQQAQSQAQSQPKADGPKDDSDDDDGGTSRRRRRRRGGRGRRGTRGGDEAATQEQQSLPKPAAQGDARKAEAGSDDSGDEKRTRRRRSRSRSRGRGGDEAPQPTEARPQKAQVSQDIQETAPKAARSSQGDGDDEATVVRRRRRSRRGGSDDSQAAKPAPAPAPAEPKKDESPDDASEQPKRRRRSRSRKSSTDDGPEQMAETRSETRNKAQVSSRSEAAKEKQSGPKDDEKPARRRRTRSRSSSRQADAKSAPPEAPSRDEKPAAARNDGGPPKGSPDDAPSEAPRRRRSRSRSRSRGDDGGTASGGQDAKASAGDVSGQHDSGSNSGSNGDSSPPQAARSEARSEAKTEAKTKVETGSAAPVGVLAGQGVEPKPAKKRRWAWWGGPSDPAPDPNE